MRIESISRLILGLLGGWLLSQSVYGAEPAKPHDAGSAWQKSLAARQLATTAAFDAQGVLWLAQVQNGYLLLSHSADNGKSFAPAVQVNSQAEAISASGETRPTLAFGPAGQIYVAYTQNLDTPLAGNVRFSRSLDGGQHFSAPITVNDNLDAITHRFVSMIVDRHGRIFLAWLDKRDAVAAKNRGEPFAGLSVYSAISDDEGASFHPNQRVAEHSSECSRIAMAEDGSGTPVILWRQIFGKNTRDLVLTHLSDNHYNPAPQRATFDNWRVDACPRHGPSLAIAGNMLFVTWYSNASQHSGLFYAYSSNGGRDFTPALPLGRPGHQPAHSTVLAAGQDVYLVWKEIDGDRTVLYGMRSEDRGKRWDEAQKIAETRGQADYPLLVANHGQMFVSWYTLQEGFRMLAWPPAQ